MNGALSLAGVLIAALSGGAAFLFALLSFLRARRADNLSDGMHSGAVLTELGYIKSGIDDIKRRQERQESRYADLLERVTTIEATEAARR